MGREFVTAGGVRLTLLPVRLTVVELILQKLENEWRERGEPVDPPKVPLSALGVKVFGDEEAEEELTEDMLEVPDDPVTTRSLKLLWARHKRARARLDAAKGELRTRTILRMGIKEEPPDDSWQSILTDEGLAVEETPEGRKVQWLTHAVLTDPQDLSTVISELYVLSAGRSVKPEDIDLFRRGIQGSIERGIRQSLDRAIEAAGTVGGEPGVPGGRGGDSLASDAEPVGEVQPRGQGEDDGLRQSQAHDGGSGSGKD